MTINKFKKKLKTIMANVKKTPQVPKNKILTPNIK